MTVLGLAPRSSRELTVPVKPSVVLARFAEALTVAGHPRELAGRVSPSGFHISGVRRRWNAYGPVLIGSVEPTDGGTVVRYQLALSPSAARALRFWKVTYGVLVLPLCALAIGGALLAQPVEMASVATTTVALLAASTPFLQARRGVRRAAQLQDWLDAQVATLRAGAG